MSSSPRSRPTTAAENADNSPQRHKDTKGKITEPIPAAVNELSNSVVDAAFAVHKELGPGLLESVYEACLCHELAIRKVPFRSQVPLPVTHKGLRLDAGLRLDLLVADSIIVELKSVQRIELVFEAQLLSYLRLTGLRLGLLINFNVPLIKHGITRVVL
jgi:GxxExxY protein